MLKGPQSEPKIYLGKLFLKCILLQKSNLPSFQSQFAAGVSRALESSGLLSNYYITSAIFICILSIGQAYKNSIYLEHQ